MIKFYKDTYQNLMTNLSGNANAICFATDRHVILLNGKEYGKDVDAVKLLDGLSKYDFNPNMEGQGNGNADPLSGVKDGVTFASGTLVAFNNNDSIWRYNGGTSWTPVVIGTAKPAELGISDDANGNITMSASTISGGEAKVSVADLLSAAQHQEAKVSTAYAAASALLKANGVSGTNNILVSEDGGIRKTEFSFDYDGSNAAKILDTTKTAAQKTELSTVIPNAQTLAQVYQDVKSQSVTLTNTADGVITFTPDSGLTGTTWTPELHIISAVTEGTATTTPSTALVIDGNGALQVKMAIHQKTTNPGYLATYALYNEAGYDGTTETTRTQLGEDINLVKDQFLKKAEYILAITVDKGKTTEATIERGGVDGTNIAKVKEALGIAAETSVTAEALNTDVAYTNYWGRFLKLTFALTDTDKEPSGASDDQTVNPSGKASGADSVVYIDVNELFDSYTGISGIDVNKYTNQISAVVAKTAEGNETGLVATGKRGTHYGSNFLTVDANGLQIAGIKQEITAYIQDISGINHHDSTVAGVTVTAADSTYSTGGATYPTFLTNVGIGTDGVMTGAASGINANGVYYDGNAGMTLAAGSVGATISAIANHIESLDYSYDGDTMGATPDTTHTGDTYFIYAITETNGQIATSGKQIDSSNLQVSKYASNLITNLDKKIYAITTGDTPAQGSLQAGLTSIIDSVYQAIDAMDCAEIGSSVAIPDKGHKVNGVKQDSYQIINKVSEADGKITAETLALDADNVTFVPISANTAEFVALTGYVGTTPAAAVTVGAALSAISRYIASSDYSAIGQVATTPGDVTGTDAAPMYKVINQISQTDGRISGNTMDLTAGNVAATAVTAVETGAAANVRVAVDGTNVAKQIDDISNTIADYLSFHNATGAVI